MNASLRFSFPLRNYSAAACCGAFCEAFEILKWTITSLRPSYELAGSIISASGKEEDAKVLIRLQDEKSFLVELTASLDTVSEEYLEECRKQFIFVTSKMMDEALQLLLESDFKRYLQNAELASVKEDKTTVFRLAYQLFFTDHPAQMVAWIGLINVVVFIAMTIAGAGFWDTDVTKAIEWGAADKRHIMQGEYWRLLASCFIHFGFGHIAGNMIGLLYASFILMLAINRWQFLFGYLATGITAMAFSIYWHNDTVTAGASGAIFGCYGMLMGVALTSVLKREDRVAIFLYLLFFAGFNLVYGLKDGIDNAAHVAGLLSGTVIGLVYVLPMKWNDKKLLKPLTVLFALVFGLGCSSFLIHHSTYYAFEFDRLDKKYSALEHDGLQYYRVNDTINGAKIDLLLLGIENFKKASLCVDTMEQMDGKPDDIVMYTDHLKEYTDLRIRALDLELKNFREGTNDHEDSLRNTYHKIDQLLKLMKDE